MRFNVAIIDIILSSNRLRWFFKRIEFYKQRKCEEKVLENISKSRRLKENLFWGKDLSLLQTWISYQLYDPLRGNRVGSNLLFDNFPKSI